MVARARPKTKIHFYFLWHQPSAISSVTINNNNTAHSRGMVSIDVSRAHNAPQRHIHATVYDLNARQSLACLLCEGVSEHSCGWSHQKLARFPNPPNFQWNAGSDDSPDISLITFLTLKNEICQCETTSKLLDGTVMRPNVPFRILKSRPKTKVYR